MSERFAVGRFGPLMLAVALGCGTTHEPPTDAGAPPGDATVRDTGTSDAGASGDAGPLDAGASDAGPEPCSTPGAIERVACGFCGTTERFCTAEGFWQYDLCVEAAGSECMPGTTTEQPCGRCGVQTVRCTDACRWTATGECHDETGACAPGTSEREGCGDMGVRVRVCEESCTFGPFSDCRLPPTDFDGDGSPYGRDCDDANASVFIGSRMRCGSFACADPMAPGGTIMRPGWRTCAGPGWSECVRATDCLEATCAERFVSERRECATGMCELMPPTQFRSCRPPGDWSAWSECPISPPPPDCTVTESPCGACGEGSRFEYCDGGCSRVQTACLGSGCVPGSVTRTSAGCPAGQVRERECTRSCALGPPGPCVTPPAAEVEIMLLVDITGSHYDLVMGAIPTIMGELVDPLLASPRGVAIGVAAFADFPIGPYGDASDVPFMGVLAPTTDSTAIYAALTGLLRAGGGDWEESGIEALATLAGAPAHPLSMPFTCPSGTEPGGCWSPGSERAIVILTDAAMHNGPAEPMPGGPLLVPYTTVPPPAPAEWPDVPPLFAARAISLFAAVLDQPTGMLPAPLQFEFMFMELGVDPFAHFVPYPDPMELMHVLPWLRDLISTRYGL